MNRKQEKNNTVTANPEGETEETVEAHKKNYLICIERGGGGGGHKTYCNTYPKRRRYVLLKNTRACVETIWITHTVCICFLCVLLVNVIGIVK